MNIICIEDNEMDKCLIEKKVKEVCPQCDFKKYRYLNDFLKSSHPYDLVITDLMLPDEYGPDVLIKIRNVTGKPIIVISGVGGHIIPIPMLKTIKNAGATIFLSKNQNGFNRLPEAIKSFL